MKLNKIRHAVKSSWHRQMTNCVFVKCIREY